MKRYICTKVMFSAVYIAVLSDLVKPSLLVQLRKVKSELGELSNNPQGLLLEAVHSAGYSGALANPLLASETALNRLNSSLLEEFVAV